MLYLIGLGLGDIKDITVKGLEAVKKCDRILLEAYTSILIDSSKAELEEFFGGKKIIEADREFIESDQICQKEILDPAKTQNVALLVVGGLKLNTKCL